MKLQRSPLILLVSALVLGGFVYFHEIQGAPKREEAQTKNEALFSFQEAEVQMLNLTTPTQMVSLIKPLSAKPGTDPKSQTPSADKSKSPVSSWQMTAPKQTPANDASVAYLLNLMATGKRQQVLKVPAARQAEFGFDKPLAVVEVKLSDQKTHRLILGKPNFNRSALYAQVDPPLTPGPDLSVVLVSLDFENAVKRPLGEWEVAKEKPADQKSNQQSDQKPDQRPNPSTADKQSSQPTPSPSQ